MRRGWPLLLLAFGCAAPATRTLEEPNLLQRLVRDVEELKTRQEEDPVAMREIARLWAEVDSLKAQQARFRAIEEEQRNIGNQVALLDDQVARLEERMKRLAGMPSPKPKVAAFRPAGYETESAYRAALQDYRAKKYDQAIGEFSEILAIAPGSKWADNAQYWIGECYYALENYRHSITEFQKVFAYPGSEKEDDAQFKIALSYIKLGDRERAREALERFLRNYPESEYVPKARSLLEELR